MAAGAPAGVLSKAPNKVREAVERACVRTSDALELFDEVGAILQDAIPHDGSIWFGLDPATLLAVAPARVQNLDPDYCDAFWEAEFHEHDAGLYAALARDEVPAAGLHLATGGAPLTSYRYREVVRPQGYADELRAAFRAGGQAWGVVSLYREPCHAPFDEADVALLASISEDVGAAMRARTALTVATAAWSAPGLLLFDADNRLISANDEAERWLDGLFGLHRQHLTPQTMFEGRDGEVLAPAITVIPLLSRARAVAKGRDRGQARLRIRDESGRWVVLHASCLGGPDGQIAVVVEAAKSAEIAPIIIEAYGLSVRERGVVKCLARGMSTPEIAAELFLSSHTVRDYVKSVFEKLGVNSRGELVARLFAEHYEEDLHAKIVHA